MSKMDAMVVGNGQDDEIVYSKTTSIQVRRYVSYEIVGLKYCNAQKEYTYFGWLFRSVKVCTLLVMFTVQVNINDEL